MPTNVFDISKYGPVRNLELNRLGDDRKEWELRLGDSNNTICIILDRKNMKDLIDALEAERYGTAKNVGV